MAELIAECERFENTLYFQVLSLEQQADVRALPTEAEKRERGAALLAEIGSNRG